VVNARMCPPSLPFATSSASSLSFYPTVLRKQGQPDWENISPEQRRIAVLKIQPAEDEGRALLKRLAAEDEDAGVRSAALGQLEEIEFLYRRYREDPAPEPRHIARMQLGRLLAATPAPAGVSPSIVVLSHPLAERRRHTLQEISEPTLLAEVATYTEEEEVRRAAAARITDISLLRTILRQVQGRNRVGARIMRERIKVLQQQQKAQEEQTQQLEILCAGLETLAASPWERNYAHRLQHLLGQWQHVSTQVSQVYKVRWDDAKRRCQAVLDSHRQQETFPEQSCKSLEDAIARLNSPKQNSPEAIHLLLEQEARDWKAIPEYMPPSAEIKARREAARNTLQSCARTLAALEKNTSLLQSAMEAAKGVAAPPGQSQALKQLNTVLEKLPWPEDVPVPRALAAAQKVQLQLAEQCAHARQKQEDAKQQLERLFAELHRALRDNRFESARGAYQQLQKKLNTLPEKQRASTQQRLDNLGKQLKNLADWKSFATEPQLREMCCQMEALGNEKMHPKEKFRRIKDLQDKWRTLGSSPAAEMLWPRFREAGNRAFEPCAEFFAKEKARREQNLVQRQKALQQLEGCLADANQEKPDWQKILPVLASAERMWEQHRAVPVKEGAALEKNYHDVRSSLRTLLAPVLAAHESRKHTLIKQAQALSAHKRAERAAMEGRLLRDAWKQLGRGDNEQALLAEFDAALNPVFEQLRKEQETAQQARVAERDTLQKAVTRIAELAQLEDKELARSREECQSLAEQVETGLSALPGREQVPLKREFQKARDRWQQRFDTLGERQREQQTQELMRLAALCRRLEEVQGSRDAIAKEVEQSWSEGLALQSSLAQRMEKRRQSALARNEKDTKSQLDLVPQRRLLCIQLEILAGLDTPEKDAATRMQYQMERLRQGLGQDQLGREEQLKQLQALSQDWLCGPVADRDTEQALAERFEAAYAAVRKQVAEPPRTQAKQKTDKKNKPRNNEKRHLHGRGKQRKKRR